MNHSSVAVARYLVERAAEFNRVLSPMKLIKLVYMAHGWMLGLYGRPLVREEVEAWQYGPVIPELYQRVKKFRTRPVPIDGLASNEDAADFDAREKKLLDQVHDIYGKHTAIKLSQMTHSENTPWEMIWNNSGRSGVIPNDVIEEHYSNLYKQYSEAAQEKTDG